MKDVFINAVPLRGTSSEKSRRHSRTGGFSMFMFVFCFSLSTFSDTESRAVEDCFGIDVGSLKSVISLSSIPVYHG